MLQFHNVTDRQFIDTGIRMLVTRFDDLIIRLLLSIIVLSSSAHSFLVKPVTRRLQNNELYIEFVTNLFKLDFS